jgi:hypothetical protein
MQQEQQVYSRIVVGYSSNAFKGKQNGPVHKLCGADCSIPSSKRGDHCRGHVLLRCCSELKVVSCMLCAAAAR